jgi:hypothetical protein
VRAGAGGLLKQFDTERLVDHHLDDVRHHDDSAIDHVDNRRHQHIEHVPDVGHAGPADGHGHGVLLPVEEHQL